MGGQLQSHVLLKAATFYTDGPDFCEYVGTYGEATCAMNSTGVELFNVISKGYFIPPRSGVYQ